MKLRSENEFFQAARMGDRAKRKGKGEEVETPQFLKDEPSYTQNRHNDTFPELHKNEEKFDHEFALKMRADQANIDIHMKTEREKMANPGKARHMESKLLKVPYYRRF